MIDLILSAAVALSATSACPKPIHHTHHKSAAPVCYCDPGTHTVLFVERDPEPIELNILRYYVPLTSTDMTPEIGVWNWDWDASDHYDWGLPTVPVGQWVAQSTKAPEIDPSSGLAALTLLAGCIAVIRGPRV